MIALTDHYSDRGQTLRMILSLAVQTKLRAKCVCANEPRGAILYRSDEKPFGAFLVCRGSACLHLESREGVTVMNRALPAGSIFGLAATLSGSCYACTAITLEDCEIVFLNPLAVKELIKNDPFTGFELLRAVAEETAMLKELVPTLRKPRPRAS